MAVRERVTSRGRVETFSDGVFAIAITLLVLDLRAPEDSATFLADLAAQWPSYLAFVAAFAVLGLIWLSHHALFTRLKAVNASLLLRNLLLLFLAAVFSFPTGVLAASFRDESAKTNQLVAIGIFELTAIAITLAWVWLCRILVVSPHLAKDPAEAAAYVRQQTLFGGIACALLAIAFAAGFFSTLASILLTALLPLINIAFYRRSQRFAGDGASDRFTEG